jgi:hypothetical protein
LNSDYSDRLLGDKLREHISDMVEHAEGLLDRARLSLDALERSLHEKLHLPFKPSGVDYFARSRFPTFTVDAGSLMGRLDAAFYDPRTLSCREALRLAGGVRLNELAELRLLGRYKRYYVSPPFGRPILSGRQLLQLRPVALKNISDRSFSDPSAFVLEKGWTIFTCDGRSEEALASPAFVSSLWDEWMASNHVMRAIPREGVSAGFLYLALRSPYVQMQLKSKASGSVIDALEPTSIGDVILPCVSKTEQKSIGKKVEAAWEDIAEYTRTMSRAIARMESALSEHRAIAG